MELELENTTDINNKEVISKEPQFKLKNTLFYQGLLTNFTDKTYKGFPTTSGNDIEINENSISYNNGSTSCLLIETTEDTYKGTNRCSYVLDAYGDILDTTSTYDNCLVTVLQDTEGNYRVQVNGKTIIKNEHPIAIIDKDIDSKTIRVIETHRETETIEVEEDNDNKEENIDTLVDTFADEQEDESEDEEPKGPTLVTCACLSTTVYSIDLVSCEYNEVCKFETPYDGCLDFCSNNAYHLGCTLFIGSDWEDQTKSGTLIINNDQHCYVPFFGRVSLPKNENSLYLFGEPIPDVADFFICPNKEVRFEIGPMPTICCTPSCVISLATLACAYTGNCTFVVNENYHEVEYRDPVSLLYAYEVEINDCINLTKCLIEPQSKIENSAYFCICISKQWTCNCYQVVCFDEHTCRSFVNPNTEAAPGDSWTENCFLSCVITNLACSRNKNYVYSKFGTQLLYNDRIVTDLRFDIKGYNINPDSYFQYYCFNGAFESEYRCLCMSHLGCTKQSAVECMINDGWDFYHCGDCLICSDVVNTTYPIIAGICASVIPTTEYTYCGCLKFIKPTCSVVTSKVWPKIQHTYDWNLGDLNTKWCVGDKFKTVMYHGLHLGYSLCGVLLNNINFDGDATSLNYNDKCFSIAVGNTIYNYSTEAPITVCKVADFNYGTNIVAPNNFLKEDRTTGQLSVLQSSISFIPEFEIDLDRLPRFIQPSLGNTANDTLFVNLAYNANMESRFATTSALLPSYQLGIYVPSDAGNALNQTIYGTLNTIVTPIVDDTKYAICVYATHTLRSTSVDYLYTTTNGVVSTDVDLNETTWWPDATTTYLPVSLMSCLSNINGLASSVCLSQDFSASFSVCDNTMMTVYNNAEQVYRASNVFTIYGSRYYYDGQGIYFLAADGSQQLAAYALGMTYLAASSSEAYFFSNSDRNIYSFTGSNTMNVSVQAADVGDVKDALFDSTNQLLWILFEEGLYVKSTTSSESSFFGNVKGYKLLSQTKSIAVLSNDGPNLSLSVQAFDTHLPLELESEWIGMNDAGYRIPYFDILIHNDGMEHDLEITASVLANGKVKKDVRKIHINKSDFAGGTFYRARVTPTDNTGNAAKIRVYSKDKVSIQGIIIQATEDSVGAPNI